MDQLLDPLKYTGTKQVWVIQLRGRGGAGSTRASAGPLENLQQVGSKVYVLHLIGWDNKTCFLITSPDVKQQCIKWWPSCPRFGSRDPLARSYKMFLFPLPVHLIYHVWCLSWLYASIDCPLPPDFGQQCLPKKNSLKRLCATNHCCGCKIYNVASGFDLFQSYPNGCRYDEGTQTKSKTYLRSQKKNRTFS